MSDSAHTVERGEIQMATLTWSREVFGNAVRAWTEGTRQWAPWLVPTAKPAQFLQQAVEFADKVLSQQEEFARSLVRALPGPSPLATAPASSRAATEAAALPGEAGDVPTAAALRRVEEERDAARAAEATARRALATVRAERDEAVEALRAAQADARQARAQAKEAATARPKRPAPARRAAASPAKKKAAAPPAKKKAASSTTKKAAAPPAKKKAAASPAKKAAPAAKKKAAKTSRSPRRPSSR